eukprot:TRINITY_DN1109_c0_g1_i2.p2 TRINITY_DN1109_c0_g1~~TRINITY_DN1109_c0_g1_i2.p2  ORF type:complete len:332 (-),score=66.04 TRINITY_DN1109_c0_g1_i2:2064-3059(-)
MITIRVKFCCSWFNVDVLPTDTVWTLKWKIYHNENMWDCYTHPWDDIFPLGPDDQVLQVFGGETLDNCERSLDSYSIEEGSEILCDDTSWRKEEEKSFRRILKVFRKARTSSLILTGVTSVSWVKHASLHVHEVRFINLKFLAKMLSTISGSILHARPMMHCMIHGFPSLKKMDLSSNQLVADEEWIRFAEGLETNTSLKTLDISWCHISVEAGIRIGHMLTKNSSLEILNISGNGNIGDEGCLQISIGLINNYALRVLAFHKCRIGLRGAIGLGQMLVKNFFLEKLDLYSNDEIGDEGMARIAEGLEFNTGLKEICVTACGVGLKHAELD